MFTKKIKNLNELNLGDIFTIEDESSMYMKVLYPKDPFNLYAIHTRVLALYTIPEEVKAEDITVYPNAEMELRFKPHS